MKRHLEDTDAVYIYRMAFFGPTQHVGKTFRHRLNTRRIVTALAILHVVNRYVFTNSKPLP
ncbi:hypothetical protein [Pseudomonas sp. NPDC090201]|jgi:hypothetical protein|uniref:hypothetical protein n=1 Tax=Pseudomonas sp. NPDC090201 TaxID=3364475 RepID=UPI00381EDE55